MRHSRHALVLAFLGTGLVGSPGLSEQVEGYVRMVSGPGQEVTGASPAATGPELRAPTLPAPVPSDDAAEPVFLLTSAKETDLARKPAWSGFPAGVVAPQRMLPVVVTPALISVPSAARSLSFIRTSPVAGGSVTDLVSFPLVEATEMHGARKPAMDGYPTLVDAPVQHAREVAMAQSAPVPLPIVAARPSAGIRTTPVVVGSVAGLTSLPLADSTESLATRKPAMASYPSLVDAPTRTPTELAIAQEAASERSRSAVAESTLPTIRAIRTTPVSNGRTPELAELAVSPIAEGSGKVVGNGAPAPSRSQIVPETFVVRTAPSPFAGHADDFTSSLRDAQLVAERTKPLVADRIDGPRTAPKRPVEGIGSGELAVVTSATSGKSLGFNPTDDFQADNASIGLRVAKANVLQVEETPPAKAVPIERGTQGPQDRKAPARARSESEIAAMLRAPLSEIGIDDPTQDYETRNERPESLAAKYAAPGIFVSCYTWAEPMHQRYTYPFIHTPLYFEDANLERCGLGYGVLQPGISGVRFITQTFLLPYSVLRRCPYEHVVSPGDCRTCEKFKCNKTSAK